MNLVGSIVDAAVMGIVGFLVIWYTKGRLDSLERRMDRMEESNERAHDALRSDLTQLRDSNDRAHGEIRGDLTRVALAVGARPRAENA